MNRLNSCHDVLDQLCGSNGVRPPDAPIVTSFGPSDEADAILVFKVFSLSGYYPTNWLGPTLKVVSSDPRVKRHYRSGLLFIIIIKAQPLTDSLTCARSLVYRVRAALASSSIFVAAGFHHVVDPSRDLTPAAIAAYEAALNQEAKAILAENTTRKPQRRVSARHRFESKRTGNWVRTLTRSPRDKSLGTAISKAVHP